MNSCSVEYCTGCVVLPVGACLNSLGLYTIFHLKYGYGALYT